jgi:hippurate hydrolase
MENHGLNADQMVKLRRLIHTYPEGGFKEFKTQKLMKDTLLKLGVKESEIKTCAGTGLVVDIKGTGPAEEVKKEGTVSLVALRADMDGLPMPENNPELDYKSKTDFAHMCGHDGHMASLMTFTQVYMANRDKIPSNKGVRLLFQPAEEGPGGALPMVKEGCLEGVDEVYGYHNMPNFDEGDIRVCEGAIFAAVTVVKIKIIGQGGHGSAPHKLRDPITAGAMVH